LKTFVKKICIRSATCSCFGDSLLKSLSGHMSTHTKTCIPHCSHLLFYGFLCLISVFAFGLHCIAYSQMRNANTNASRLLPSYSYHFVPLSLISLPFLYVLGFLNSTLSLPSSVLMVCMLLCPGYFCLLVWVPLVSVCPILGGCVCSWTLTTFWMVRVTPPAHSSLPLG